MCRRQHGDQLVADQRGARKVRIHAVDGAEAEVDLAAAHARRNMLGHIIAQRHADIGMAGAQQRDGAWKELRRHRGKHRDRDPAAPPRRKIRHGGDGRLEIAEQAFGDRKKIVAGSRQRDRAGAAIEQPDLEILFQLADVQAGSAATS